MEFRFFRAAGVDPAPAAFTLARDWSGLHFLQDAPETTTTYKVEVRCAPFSTDPSAYSLESQSAGSSTALAEIFDPATRPATIRTLRLADGSSTDLFWNPAAVGLQSGVDSVTRYEVRRMPMQEDSGGQATGFPGRDVGVGDYSGFVPILGLKYLSDGSSSSQLAGPICDEPGTSGDDAFFDDAPGLDSLELPCFQDPGIPCFTDTKDPVNLNPGAKPPGYFYLVTSAPGDSIDPARAPLFRTPGSHFSRPATLPPPADCP